MKDIRKFLRKKEILERTIYYADEITFENNKKIIEQILALLSKDTEREIVLHLSSYGGDPSAGFSFYDLMKLYRPNLISIASGKCYSATLYPLLSASLENRFSTKNTLFLIHAINSYYKAGKLLSTHALGEDFKKSKLDAQMFHNILKRETMLTTKAIRQFEMKDSVINPTNAIKAKLICRVI